MVAALQKELMLRSSGENVIDTIYFGGGTPSLLTTDELKKLLAAAHQYFKIANEPEITLEANPDDINPIKLAEWKSAGINRFSIGVQSLQQEDLAWMNRAHNAEEALQSIQLVKDSGFENFSIDLIYGTQTLPDARWKENVETIIALEVPHISCYALTVEENTALHKMIGLQKKEQVDPEKAASQFLLLMEWLANAGYEHYEISNFAKPGYRSKHNSSYWQGVSYIGIGPSAHSFDGNTRRWNVSNNPAYIRSLQKDCIPFEEENISIVQKLNEYIMTSLRTMEGIDLDLVAHNFGEHAKNILETAAGKYVANDKLNNVNHKLILTKEGKLFADGIAADLFFEEAVLALHRF